MAGVFKTIILLMMPWKNIM